MSKSSPVAHWFIPFIFLLVMTALFFIAGYDVLIEKNEPSDAAGKIIAAVVKPVISYWTLLFIYIGIVLLAALFSLAAGKKHYRIGFKNAFIVNTVVLALYVFIPMIIGKV